VIAVGTTAVRALETAAAGGQLKPFTGDSRLFIYPGYTFRVVDAMITNFHLSGSTLLMLVRPSPAAKPSWPPIAMRSSSGIGFSVMGMRCLIEVRWRSEVRSRKSGLWLSSSLVP
jgi:hypothetical protein